VYERGKLLDEIATLPMSKQKTKIQILCSPARSYDCLLGSISDLIDAGKRTSARAVNIIIAATNWDIGRQLVEFEQGGKVRAQYGADLLDRLSQDLTAKHGRGFGVDNLELFRKLYHAFPPSHIQAKLAHEAGMSLSRNSESSIRKSSAPAGLPSNSDSMIRNLSLPEIAAAFPLSWTHYVHLLRRARSAEARHFYEAEALRGGWTVKQLDRQISSLFYERAILSKSKAAMLTKGTKASPEDAVSADEEIRDPLVLEFLNLRDEYSESDLEVALIRHLETFLMELGSEFAFLGRQRRLRIGAEWYRVDLLFFHRCLRCLVIIDLKLGKFSHADAGQMHLYLNYAHEHWTHEDENPPVGLILCTEKDAAVAKYALDALPNKVLAREYQLALPDEKALAAELKETRRQLDARRK